MSITDELREWWVRKFPVMDKELHKDFTAIADRIDAEHDREMMEIRNRGWNNGYDEGFASADDWLGQHESDMAEHGWVRKDKEHVVSHATIEVTPHIDWSRMADELNEQQRFIDEHYQLLPKDADGEPIHIGDVMENIVCPSVYREVTGVGAECFYGWDDGNGRYSQFDVSCYRHYHAPTVEDVLREFANEVYADADNEIRDRDFLCAKYAKRLTLAEGEDA